MSSFIDDLEKSTQTISGNLRNYFANKDAEDKKRAYFDRVDKIMAEKPVIGSRQELDTNPAAVNQLAPQPTMMDVPALAGQPPSPIRNAQSNVSSIPNRGFSGKPDMTIPVGNPGSPMNIPIAAPNEPIQSQATYAGQPTAQPLAGQPSPIAPQPTYRQVPVYGEPKSRLEAYLQSAVDSKGEMPPEAWQMFSVLQSQENSQRQRESTDLQKRNVESEINAREHPKPSYITVKRDGQFVQIPNGTMQKGDIPEDVEKAYAASEMRNPDWKSGLNPSTNKNEYYDVKKKAWTGVQVGSVTAASEAVPTDKTPGVSGLAYLKTLPTGRQSLVKQIGEGRSLMSDKVGNRGNQKLVLSEDVARAYPTYDERWVKASYKLTGDAATGNIGKSARSINTAIGHLKQFDEAARALNNVDYTGYNTLANWIAKNTGDPRVLALNETASALSSELATTFKGGASGAAGTESEIKDWRTNFQDNLSKAQYGQAVNTTLKLMGSRMHALQDQYNNVPYHPDGFDIISPKAQKILDDYGYSETMKSAPASGATADPLAKYRR